MNSYDSTPKPPAVWGPHYWFVIHTFANSYPDYPTQRDREVAVSFIKILPFILPCGECGGHALQYIKQHFKYINTIVSSRSNMVHFFFSFHNTVNTRLGKPLVSM